jgi:hypothetical protein
VGGDGDDEDECGRGQVFGLLKRYWWRNVSSLGEGQYEEDEDDEKEEKEENGSRV